MDNHGVTWEGPMPVRMITGWSISWQMHVYVNYGMRGYRLCILVQADRVKEAMSIYLDLWGLYVDWPVSSRIIDGMVPFSRLARST